MSGTLYVVATPIGNLDDVSARALEVLGHVSLIACEDTRVTSRLLKRYGIQTPMVSYHEHNERRRAPQLVNKLTAGQDVALVSDAGTPAVSDPGYRLVHEARQSGVPVRTVPGPSAVIAALAVSGLPTSSFCFLGFLPAKAGARRKTLERLAETPHTTVLFESARRIPRLLRDLADRLGARPAFLGREMTKLHEEHRCGTLDELAAWATTTTLRGELTLVVSPGERSSSNALSAGEMLSRYRRKAALCRSRREAIKELARELGRPSRQIYREILDLHSAEGNVEDEDT